MADPPSITFVRKEMATMERIIIGYDDSRGARGALTWSVQYAKRTASELVVVYVFSEVWEWEFAAVQVDTDRLRREFERRLREEWSASVRAAGVQYRIELEVGRPAESLLAAAHRNEAALIVVGMSEGGALSELIRGSASHQMMQHAVRPIVTVPAGWEPSSVVTDGALEVSARSRNG